MSQYSHGHPEEYTAQETARRMNSYREITDAERDAALDERREIAAYLWRCVPCDLTHDGAEMVEDGFERDTYGAIKCPNCGRTFNYDERSKKQARALLAKVQEGK